MSITRNIKKSNITPVSKIIPTTNKYIAISNGKHYLEPEKVGSFLLQYPSPMEEGQSGIRRFLNDRNKGLFRISNMLDYTQEVSEEKLEKFLFDSVSIYLFQEPGKFPPKKKEKLDMSPEDFEDIDDSPPNDQGLEDLDITTEDFKL